MSRFRILILFVAVVALAASFAACGGGSGGSGDPKTIVDDATLKGIDSANLDLSLGIDVQGENSGHVDVGLSGPIQGGSDGESTELDLTATAKGSVGGEKVDFEGGFTLLGNKAYVGFQGTEYEVDPTTFNFVKSLIKRQGGGQAQSGEASACQEALGDLEPSDFIDNLVDEGSAEVGGVSTTKVSGDLDVEGALEAGIELSEEPACSELGAAAGQLPSTAELDQAQSLIEDSVKSAHVVIYVGEDDIVRRVSAQVQIEPSGGSSAGGAKSVGLDLDVNLNGVNEEQKVSAPKSTRPLGELFLKLGINPIELLGLLEGGGLGGPGGLEGLLKRFGDAGSVQ